MTRIDTKTIWNGDIVKIQGKKVVKSSTYEIGLVIEGQAKELCPVRYGYLKASINTQSKDEGTELESPAKYGIKQIKTIGGDVSTFKKITKPTDDLETDVGTAVEYGPHIEWGTIKMDAQPFLRPAFQLAQGKVIPIIKAEGKYHFVEFLVQHEQYLQSKGI
jgi:HK97 gp10 family phage protein